MGVGGQRHAPVALPLGKRPGTHCIAGWVGPRASVDSCGKSRPPPGFNPQTLQPVVSRYTDCAILAPIRPLLLQYTCTCLKAIMLHMGKNPYFIYFDIFQKNSS
jgi:hypothetical protein